jgi:glycosyltransferase involved in cell wall biosynthesis
MRPIVFIAPGRLDTWTGGYGYDRRMVAGLRHRGWAVEVEELDESFPTPTPAALAHAARLLAAIPADAIVLVDGLALGAMPAVVEAEAARLRLVALVHHPLAAETGIAPTRAALLATSERRALAVARLVVVTSRATASTLEGYGLGTERLQVVEPGTDRAPLARGSGGPFLQLLCVATLIPRKGHDVLFDALGAISDCNWRLTCVGSPQRHPNTAERLRASLRIRGLEGRVELAGEVDVTTLAAYYDRADLFVLPTLYEGYGMAVAEALARGLPVVSTTTGAIAELVPSEAGLLVPPGDVDALAAALSQVLGDSGLRARLAEGARHARERLVSWEDASARMAHALERVAADG